jgi:hypothetical protein
LKKIIISCLVLFSTSSHAWSLFGPASYDDCVLVSIKDAQNPQAVYAVKSACRSKFPKTDAEASCEEFLSSNSTMTFANIREISGYENLTDDQIIKHLADNNINNGNLIAEKRCKNSGYKDK